MVFVFFEPRRDAAQRTSHEESRDRARLVIMVCLSKEISGRVFASGSSSECRTGGYAGPGRTGVAPVPTEQRPARGHVLRKSLLPSLEDQALHA